MDNKKTTTVSITDYYGDCIQDSVFSKISRNSENRLRPKGFVEIYEKDENSDKKKLIGRHNLVVYRGREWLLERAFDIQNENITPSKDEFLCWFGLGTGGCPVGDPLDPVSPTNLDTDLSIPCGISQTDASCAEYIDGWYYKHRFASVTFAQDPENSLAWLLSTITITISAGDAVGFNLSEAGLFTASSNAAGYVGPFSLYARVTFPTIVKTTARELVFVWNVYY